MRELRQSPGVAGPIAQVASVATGHDNEWAGEAGIMWSRASLVSSITGVAALLVVVDSAVAADFVQANALPQSADWLNWLVSQQTQIFAVIGGLCVLGLYFVPGFRQSIGQGVGEIISTLSRFTNFFGMSTFGGPGWLPQLGPKWINISAGTLVGGVIIVVVTVIMRLDTKVEATEAVWTLPPPACNPARPSATVAVVLLHGWRGQGDTTWANLPALFCADDTLKDSELYVVNYPTYLGRPQLPVVSLTRWLRQRFFSDTLKKYAYIDIIAHSMGGPIARRLFVNDVTAGEKSKIRSVISVASPYLGAQVAALAQALGISQDLTTDMAPRSSFLQLLDNDWTDLRVKPATYCFTSPQDAIVAPESARNACDCKHDYPQWGHVDMVKPTIAGDERYQMPIRALKNVWAAARAPQSPPPACFSLAKGRPVVPLRG